MILIRKTISGTGDLPKAIHYPATGTRIVPPMGCWKDDDWFSFRDVCELPWIVSFLDLPKPKGQHESTLFTSFESRQKLLLMRWLQDSFCVKGLNKMEAKFQVANCVWNFSHVFFAPLDGRFLSWGKRRGLLSVSTLSTLAPKSAAADDALGGLVTWLKGRAYAPAFVWR